MVRVTQASVDLAIAVVAGVVLITTATSGPGWGGASIETVIATQLDRSALSPLYHLLASAAAAFPVGEPGFRLAVLSALLGAVTLLGVIHAVRALLPAQPVAATLSAVLLVLAPPWRLAAAQPGPAMLAACGTVWALAFALEQARDPNPRRALSALAACAVVVGSAPWLGLGLLVLVGAWHRKTTPLVPALAGLGALIVLLWLGAFGSLPPIRSDLAAAVAATGVGSASLLVGVGLLAGAFGALTGLPHARGLFGAILLAAVHAVLVDPSASPLLGLFAIAVGIVPVAITRILPKESPRRSLVSVIAAVPLVGLALATGTVLTVDNPRDTPARLATDLVSSLPPGPGTFVATRTIPWAAIRHEQGIAGLRPDLTLAPLSPSDVDIANALRAKKIAGSDQFAFGRLDPSRAVPRGRGFQLLGDSRLDTVVPPLPPATYATAIGETESILLALARARYEAGAGRLDAAAKAAGLGPRFSGSDLAILSTTIPSAEIPAFYGFIPALGEPAGRWQLDLLGDDLAWVGGIEQPVVAGPPPRVLHARWRALWRGEIKADDASITALGPDAVAATAELMKTFPR